MKSWSQNLVPNGSFECGEDLCQPFQVSDIAVFSKYACDWSVPGQGTTDIFSTRVTDNTCYTHMPNSVASQTTGSQLPRTGQRYAGLYTYSNGLQVNDTTSYREYLQVKLKKPIEAGRKYCAELYVSLADNSKYAANNIGIWFNETDAYSGDYQPLYYNTPQVLEKKIIDDTSKWVKVYHEFILNEPANFAVIGNFFSDTKTQAQISNESSQARSLSYYFIDDVKVEKFPYDYFVKTGATQVCKGESIELNVTAGVDEVYWTTLEDTTSIIHVGEKYSLKPETDLHFRVKSTGCYKTVVDTITIKVNPMPKVELGPDTLLCKSSILKLVAGDANSSNFYRWQDNSMSNSYDVSSEGTYSVEVSNAFNCMVRDEIKIKFDDIPEINLGRDTLLCGEFYPLRAGGKEYSYLWSSGSTDSTYQPVKPGTYWVEAENHCGVSKDSITLYRSSDIFFPNVVTANYDAVNDYFELAIQNEHGSIEKAPEISFSLKVYNRWGELVHAQYPYKNNWPSDNTFPSGDYYYFADVQGCKTFKGWIQIIR